MGMKYLRKYNESQWVPAGIKDLSLDIEDILLEFADSGLLTEVNIINNDICIYIATHQGPSKFCLDDEKRDALMRTISLSEKHDMRYTACMGYPDTSIYIYPDDDRGVRSGGMKIPDDFAMNYIKINLTSKFNI
jgi:hypothetical protein